MTDSVSKLTARAFSRFLDLLDSGDRDRAAVEYERLRERAAGLLRWWGALNPDELADETLDRVARKIDSGADVTPSSLAAYVRGVARMVFYEARRLSDDPVEVRDVPAPPPGEQSKALDCLDHCLGELPNSERRLVLRYYDDNKIEVRRRIAQELQISMTALRIRMHRLRTRLETCVSDCMKRFPDFDHPLRA
ncbi:MAG TPA: hypothetical protein VL284_06940 [Thermoanaerobaculia bacterium]|nr:hypothetical protein [Thermoanaerobaculia bacterium]